MEERVEVTLPKLGESIVGATVVQWLKKVGETVALDEPLLEVSTDKVNSEIPSPYAGVLEEIFVEQDQEIEVGAPLALLSVGAVSEKAPSPPPAESQPKPEVSSVKEEVYSPAVLRLAQVEGISMDTMRKLEGTGEGRRITKKDLEHYIATKSESPSPTCAAVQATAATASEERIPMTRMRKAIADNMVRSFYQAPHASLVIEVDVTNVMQMIAKEKTRFLEIHGVKLTLTSFLIQALTKAVQQFPILNASLEEETIIMKRYVNLGIAVHVEEGLMVPVIKNCQERNLVSLAKAIGELSQKARSSKLAPDEVTEGTITLTNFGMTGTLLGTPIIRYPEVAIIGAGTVQKRVVVREDDSFAVRQMMYLTLTFDHRVIDGIYGCQFLAAFKSHLESV
ncbi:MAG: Dihydrolipoyllysine-residue succinyltransferase component of 2-oxoglutarate dehydrogenase complex [Chlamydiae bacterium]|nr:Dihydrolipoyllysine-residue succinyltransferase component of 2-oxoglutarate dehydrogenase complex [Chlamydiota bacterium]